MGVYAIDSFLLLFYLFIYLFIF